jgi:hypothetical protein
MTFDNKIKKEGKRYAHIAEDLEVRGRFKDEKGDWHLDGKLTGSTHLPLQAGGVSSMQLTGRLIMSAKFSEDGRLWEEKVSGQTIVEVKTSRTRE